MGNSPPCLTVWFDKIFAKKMNVPKFQMVDSTEVGNNLVLGYAHHLLKMYICTCLTMIYGLIPSLMNGLWLDMWKCQ